MLDELSYEKGSFYIMDKGYVDFTRLHKLHTCGAYFVTRAKNNMRFRRMYSREVDKTTGIKCDQIGMLETYKSLKAYPNKLRRVKYYDEELDREFVFITNNMELSAEEIALLYKSRWQVELFFKWIKQHLKVNLLGHYDECSQDTSVLCHHNILSGCHCCLQIESQPSNLRNSTNFELFSTGQNTCKRDTYRLRLQKCQRTKL